MSTNNTYFTLPDLKASSVAEGTAFLVKVPNVDDGAFFWTLGNFTDLDDNKNIIKADSTALSVGAWVRQRADSIFYKYSNTAPFVRTRNALEALRDAGASVKDTGAIGNGTANDTEAVQEIMDYFATRGGKWHLPAGYYKTTAVLQFDCALSQLIVGRGQRRVYPSGIDMSISTDLAVIVPHHAQREAIRFRGDVNGEGSITIRDLAIAADRTEGRPVACFGIDMEETFLRNFRLQNVSINDFVSAFDLYNSGATAMNQAGLLSVQHCNIHRNDWIARTLDDTQWNGFSFCHNEAGQNGYGLGTGGINIRAHNVSILDNCFEGMRDPIKVSGGYRGVDVRGNYFEANVGVALIQLDQTAGPWEIGPNCVLDVDEFANIDHIALATHCSPGRSALPLRTFGIHKSPLTPVGAGALNRDNPGGSTVTRGILRCDSFADGNFTELPKHLAIELQRATVNARELSPFDGRAMPVSEYTTETIGRIPFSFTLSGDAGHYVVVSWLVKRLADNEADADPYLSINVNGNGGAGSRDYPVLNYRTWWAYDEWSLITAAVKLGVGMTSLSLGAYPFGPSPAAGRMARYLNPVVYTVSDPNDVRPYVDPYWAQSVLTAPAQGTWTRGDVLGDATSGGFQKCTTSGTPGTWANI